MQSEEKSLLFKFRFPPLLIVLVFCGLMIISNSYLPRFDDLHALRLVLACVSVAVGVLFVAFGVIQFKSSETTINPYKPESSSTLVTNGVYGVTRNPMYVGFVFVLLGVTCFFSNVASPLLVLVFILYMNAVQIPAEEKALGSVFGEHYAQYQMRVRRWL